MFRHYLRLVLFALGLLLGVQVPGFINDYSQRIEAHWQESEQGLKGFRETAKNFFKGDLEALVAHYQASDDPVFNSDADSLNLLLDRSRLLDGEWRAMQGPWYAKAWHVASAADPELLEETYQGYRYQVLLAPEVIAWGIACALLLAWLVECLLLGAGWTLGVGRKHKIIQHEQRHWR
ncbi:DUF2937 family protein [Pseudomonas cavernicola]|uniref:DUF2937 family protein n=1 Tax=Pseudomonas cavernicola TaxID=2320866 RepID=A0A418XN81_9PSED|nr:DUF2937 family protein [Pseudomonas cavernicola]RJG13907.1 DUF2937 family protein [Pseudomonas cavernicola]